MPTKWMDDLVNAAGSLWMLIAPERLLLKSFKEVYVYQWMSSS